MEGAIILALGLATSWLGSNPLFVFGAFNNSLEILASSRKERFHEMGTHQQTCKLSTLTSCRVDDENAEVISEPLRWAYVSNTVSSVSNTALINQLKAIW